MWYLYISGRPKKCSDIPVSKLSKCITPSSGTTKLKPITVQIPLKDTVISENLSRGIVDDSKPATSTQITSYQSNCISFHRIL